MNMKLSWSPLHEQALQNYLDRLVNHFYKILPMRESGEESLAAYMESLQAELLGCSALLEKINSDPLFVSLVSILQYLIDRPNGSVYIYRREVFKSISICKKINARYDHIDTGGGD